MYARKNAAVFERLEIDLRHARMRIIKACKERVRDKSHIRQEEMSEALVGEKGDLAVKKFVCAVAMFVFIAHKPEAFEKSVGFPCGAQITLFAFQRGKSGVLIPFVAQSIHLVRSKKRKILFGLVDPAPFAVVLCTESIGGIFLVALIEKHNVFLQGVSKRLCRLAGAV